MNFRRAVLALIAATVSTPALALEFTCVFNERKGESPFVFYINQLDADKSTAQFTVKGQPPLGMVYRVKSDILTLLGNESSASSEADYMISVVLGDKQPFKVVYSVHFFTLVKELNLKMATPFQREGTCRADK